MATPEALSVRQRVVKRAFDLILGGIGFVLTLPIVAVATVLASRDTGASGIFCQERVGRYGEVFEVRKIRTMRVSDHQTTTVTASHDARITALGAKLRKFKIDELPQLLNVLRGEMSLVGPRPDVRGFADELTGEDRVVLSVRPGITGMASLAFRHEEELLARAADPEAYNREVIWPEKVRLNRAYVENWTLMGDIRCMIATVRSISEKEAFGA